MWFMARMQAFSSSMANASNYYDELFGSSGEEDDAPAPSVGQAVAYQEEEGQEVSGSSDDDSKPKKQRKRLTKGPKPKKPVAKPKRRAEEEEESDDEARPTVGYEEEFNERGGGGMDESDEEYQGDSEEEAQIRKKPGKTKGKKPKSPAPAPKPQNSKEKDIVDLAVDRLKKKRAKDPDENQVKEICEEIVETFEKALKSDKLAMENKQPATHKLRAIDNLLRLMGNLKVRQTLMEKHQLLTHIKKWIEPMNKNKDLPLHSVRSKLIEFLYQTDVEIDQLKESGIGKVIQALYRHQDETPPNKTLLKRIIDKWSKQIMGKSSYRNKSIDDDEENARRVDSSAPTYFESQTSRGVKIARRTGFSFQIMPQSRVQGGQKSVGPRRDDEAEEVAEREDDGEGPSKKDEVRKRMAELARKHNTKKLRAANVTT